jgi:hypothetical protein
MLALLNPHPRDSDIEFKEEGHQYTVRGKTGYTSCTTWVKNFFPKFNASVIIDKMMARPDWPQSKYFGQTKQEIMKGWNDNGKIASTYGTQMHQVIEDYYNGKVYECDKPEYGYFQRFLVDHEHLTPYRTEMRVYDEEYGLSGSIDMLFKNADGTFSIFDWKFSKEIQYKNDYGKTGFGPAKELDDCNVSHYSLQLNVYRAILQRNYGMTIKEMCLVFMHRDLSDSYLKVYVPEIDLEPYFQPHTSNKRPRIFR